MNMLGYCILFGWRSLANHLIQFLIDLDTGITVNLVILCSFSGIKRFVVSITVIYSNSRLQLIKEI